MEFTIKNIIKIVDASKFLDNELQKKVALSMPITACSLYVLEMKKRHNIKVAI